MPTDSISYQNSGYFSQLIIDYLDEKEVLKNYYHRFPSLENFKAQIEEKQASFSTENRSILVSALEKQYQNFNVSDKTKANIQLLSETKTFTVTTGHQLNLFTGPLYFLYKIISTINLCTKLKETYPENNFVPVFWMATEDHDFEEINYFNFKHLKIKWNSESQGPVGRFSTEGLQEVYDAFSKVLGQGDNANFLNKLFKEGYLNHSNLAEATRFIVNELFGKKGLLIVDGDDLSLKKLFIPFVEKELLEQKTFQKVTETNNTLAEDYPIQVNPREINLFYIENNLRERIVLKNNLYKVNNTSLVFSKNEIVELLHKHPEKFSPNVILRPLYQEVVLPNLCYIGGGGELAYWFQLKSNFEYNQIPFPILLLRNSVLLTTEKQAKKADALSLSWHDLFKNQQELFTAKTIDFSKLTIDFSEQKEHLKKQFEALTQLATQTDKSFLGAVKAQETKQIKGLENLEKRLLKAEKRVYSEKLERMITLQNELFPNQSLQERKANFSEFYLEFGNELLETMGRNLDPLKPEFTIITL